MTVMYYGNRRVFDRPPEVEQTSGGIYKNTNIVEHYANPVWYSYDSEFYTWEEWGGGGGGSTNYNTLTNKPQINSITLMSNKTSADLGLVEQNTNSIAFSLGVEETSEKIYINV